MLVTTAALTVLCVAACSPGRAVPGLGGQPHPTVCNSPPRPARRRPRRRPPAFGASVTTVGSSWRWRLRHTWHTGCPQPLSGLALIRMTYWGFDRRAHTGELIVNAAVTKKIIEVFSGARPVRQQQDDELRSTRKNMATIARPPQPYR